MYFSLILTLAIRYRDFSFWPGGQTKLFLLNFSIIFVLWFILLFIFDFYEIPPLRKFYDFLRNLIVFFVLAGFLGISYFYLQPQLGITPKTILVLDISLFLVFLVAWRYFFKFLIRIKHLKEKIVVIGFRQELKEMVPAVLSQNGYEIHLFLSPSPAIPPDLLSLSNFAKYGASSEIQKLKEVVEKEKINSIVFASDIHTDKNLMQKVFSNLPLRLNYIDFADFYEKMTKKVPLDALNEVWFLENVSRSERGPAKTVKRIFDILFALIGLLVMALLFPFMFLAIKLDSPGPVFYSQRRTGRDGKNFNIYKFRTMVQNAEQRGPRWAGENDKRITRVGHFLRKTHLDELPQAVSVLKGSLSLVGPRPERPEFVSLLIKEIPYYNIRTVVKPGVTGWAQLNFSYGDSVEDAKEKLKYDLYYIKNRSFFLDLEILLKTAKIILFAEGQ